MNERHPDIEIYLKKIETPAVLDWLAKFFEVIATKEVGESLKVTLTTNQQKLNCTIIERAVKGGYTSVWFEKNRTPWETDEECAQAAYSHFEAEVRCSNGGWESSESDSESKSDSESDDGGWIRITDKGQSIVNWHA